LICSLIGVLPLETIGRANIEQTQDVFEQVPAKKSSPLTMAV